jgi:hypothetical protein
MKISELVSALQKICDEHGDVPVYFAMYSLGIESINRVFYNDMSPHFEAGVFLENNLG